MDNEHKDLLDFLEMDPETRRRAIEHAMGTKPAASGAEKPAQPEQPSVDDQEAAELDELRKSGIRGAEFLNRKYNIQGRYNAIRNQAPESVDDEIEAIKDDRRALMTLYRSRIAKISVRDPLSLHKKTEIASAFRKLGLNV
jgi:hypothetical protein